MAAALAGFRGGITPASSNVVIYTVPAGQVARAGEINLYNNHTGVVNVRVIFGSAFFYLGAMNPGDWLPLSMFEPLNAGDTIVLYADVNNVVHYNGGIVADANA